MKDNQSHFVVSQSFFKRPVLEVSQDLLGKYLVSSSFSLRITEVEAYDGPEDLACHGSKGLTKRTEVMFGPAGHFYVYLIYGMYWMLNVVTGDKGYPAAVLLRGAGEFDGPGKLTKACRITGALNGKPLGNESGVWIEDHGEVLHESDFIRTPRIGVGYAKKWADVPYRFVLKNKRD